MNKNALLLIPLALILSGCGEKPEKADKADKAAAAEATEQVECKTENIPPVCIPIHANNKIMLNRNPMKTVPPSACLSAGTTVEFNVHPDPGVTDTVEVWPKDKADTWLAGTNSPDSSKIVITVPGSLVNGSEYYYGWTDLTTGECVDPRMEVDNQDPIETQNPEQSGVNIDEVIDEETNKAALPDD